MTEENKFQCIDTEQLYGDGVGYVSLYDASRSNESEEQRIWTVTTIASLAYGNESAKNPEALYERMKSIKHESLWEICRRAYGSFDIKSSMRCSPSKYTSTSDEQIYGVDIVAHKQNIACFRIKVPMFVRSQFMRHRSASYLEMSRRYTKGSKVPFEFYAPFKDTNGIINSNLNDMAISTYEKLIANGAHTQQASRVLPQMLYTEFYAMMETEGLKNFFQLRCSTHAQSEILIVAFAMLDLLKNHQRELYDKVKPREEQ